MNFISSYNWWYDNYNDINDLRSIKPIFFKVLTWLCIQSYFEIDISLPTATEMIGDVEREPKYHLMFTEFMRKSGM